MCQNNNAKRWWVELGGRKAAIVRPIIISKLLEWTSQGHTRTISREREKILVLFFWRFPWNMEAVIESSRLWLESEILLFFARSWVVHRLKDAHRMIIIIVWYYWYRSMAVICLCDAFRKFNGSRIIFDFVNGWNVRLSPTLLALIVFTSLSGPLSPHKIPGAFTQDLSTFHLSRICRPDNPQDDYFADRPNYASNTGVCLIPQLYEYSSNISLFVFELARWVRMLKSSDGSLISALQK